MKKTAFIALISMFCASLPLAKCLAQDLTVTFDFKTKQFTDDGLLKLQALKQGDKFQIKIVNINTNLYKVSVNRTDTGTTAALAVPAFSGFSLSDLTTLVGSLTTGGASATIKAQFQEEVAGCGKNKKPVPKPDPKTLKEAGLLD